MQFIDLKAQYNQIKENIDKRIQTVLDHQRFIMGPEVQELEEKLAQYVGVKHCIGVANGTDGLQISMMALGIGPGDEVITTPFSFIATAETIVLLGAKPIFVDINPKTYNINPNLIEQAITPKTKAILPVNLYGQCADFDKINKIAAKHNLTVIEDAAQSFGATYKTKKSCSLSTIGCTSFFPSKPLGAYGDAGACFTDDDELAKAIREIRVHGQDRRYHHSRIGINGRIDTLQAAILLAKFEIFPKEIEAKSEIGQRYSKLLKNSNVVPPYIESYNTSVYAQYTIQTDNRDELQQKLKAKDIPTAVHYPIPLNQQPALKQSIKVPVAETVANKVISLPIHPLLSKKDMNIIVQVINEQI
jgi:UDP-2-acetamido-2-deoxy-ribo-hexuluronate aminotransferase